MKDKRAEAIGKIIKIIEEYKYNDELFEGFKREILDNEKVYE